MYTSRDGSPFSAFANNHLPFTFAAMSCGRSATALQCVGITAYRESGEKGELLGGIGELLASRPAIFLL
jgi:hypothetical protein